MKTMSRVTAPTEKGEPLTGVNAPELESKANPAICCGARLTYTNLPAGSAYSPEARGRSERNFGTWQGRLPQEFLRRQGLTNWA